MSPKRHSVITLDLCTADGENRLASVPCEHQSIMTSAHHDLEAHETVRMVGVLEQFDALFIKVANKPGLRIE